MPRGVYQRSEAQLEAMRARFRAAGANTRPSEEAKRRMSEERTQHGHSKRSTGASRTYQTWLAMRQRCLNPKNPAYKNYGGRGITICERWASFANFLEDMGERSEGLSIERIDNNGNYEPGNCRWDTYKQQARNQRRNKLNPQLVQYILDHPERTLKDLASELNVHLSAISLVRRGKQWH
jgi:hypothetical protein